MSDISLSLSARSNLLSLKSTQSLLDRTSGRLSTGLKVSKPIDDAAAFFAAAALTRTAANQTTGQTNIQQTSNSIETAINGLASITKLVQTIQGTLSSLATATSVTQSNTLLGQYNTLLSQIDNLANSASYQGVNLINTSTTTVGVSFSGQPGASDLTITAIRSDSAGLNLTTIAAGLFFSQITAIAAQTSRPSFDTIASVASIASRAAVNAAPSLASSASTASINSIASAASQASNGSSPSQSSVASVESVAAAAARAAVSAINAAASTPSVASRSTIDSVASVASTPSAAGVAVAAVNTALITQINTAVGNALSQLSAAQSTLGSTNAILSVRLEFSKSYVATLQSGSAQLTVADLNEESANLTSLQTAQSLGVVSLRISSEAQQGLLRLF